MSNDYLSSLPEEMLDEISTFFGEDDNEPHQSYRSLAQTCKSFRVHFQRRLFSNVDLAAENCVRTLAEFIQVNPILASYIQTIGLKGDNMCMGLFQYPPLLAIIRAAASSSGTLPSVHLYIGALWSYANELGNDIPLNTLTHILNAPQNILDAITHLRVTDSMEAAIPAGLFRLLSNLRVVSGYFVVSSIDDKSSSNRSAEDHTPEFFRPKLDELSLGGSNPATITMLCEQILDLSAVKELEVFYTQVGSTSKSYLNTKYFLAQRLLNHAQSVQKLHLDIGVMIGPFYDLSRLQHLRECTLYLDVKSRKNPVPHLSQLLRTLPPLPEHDLEYLDLTLSFISIPPNAKDITISQVLLSPGTWKEFDAALVDIASGTRPFKLTLFFCICIPTLNFAAPSLKRLFVDWERNYLPRSSEQQNLDIVILHSYLF
ncbi:hypothetical protein BDN70DRAFT_962239 [Pholiota conissans]|uniref:F-box domain-containing protein n=1 Tax=Pholiota conissans TaxID=109636 RepID=A0A9P5YUF5_9AGAR|nr:hypothetical protein BDN70DRAFT_962239 [Pholiota conissans]